MREKEDRPYYISPINGVSFTWLNWAPLTEEECLLAASAAIEKARISSKKVLDGST